MHVESCNFAQPRAAHKDITSTQHLKQVHRSNSTETFVYIAFPVPNLSTNTDQTQLAYSTAYGCLNESDTRLLWFSKQKRIPFGKIHEKRQEIQRPKLKFRQIHTIN